MCLHPITVRFSNSTTGSTGSRSVVVPCGKCIECLKSYQSAWTVRLLHQLADSRFGIFFTLTYNDGHLPLQSDHETGESYPTVDKESLQAFLKRFRTRYYRDTGKKNLKYFITSEYGPRTLRPHYHGILFGVSEFEFQTLFSEQWNDEFGFTDYKVLSCLDKSSYKRLRYVAKYCSKGMFENPRVIDGLVQPTFHLISKGIGKSYLTNENINYHLSKFVNPRFAAGHKPSNQRLESLQDTLRINLAGFDYKMPRYYREVLFNSRKGLQSAYQDYLLEKSLRLRDEKFSLVQSDGKSNHEAYKVMLDSDLREAAQREKDAITSVEKQLNKSKI